MKTDTKMRAARHTELVSREPMKPRQIRVRSPLWEDALVAADERGEVLSEEIRKFLEHYVKAHEREKKP